MIVIRSARPHSSMFKYLLLDDLYELLEDFDEPENLVAIRHIVDRLLRFESSEDESLDEEHLLQHLRELRQQIEFEECSRMTVEQIRDAVLVWINRYQRRQREAARSRLNSFPMD